MMHGGWLKPWDAGLRFESDPISTRQVPGAHPLVRWTDRWGTRWEYQPGQLKKIEEGASWSATG
jgi:hypothetical protein